MSVSSEEHEKFIEISQIAVQLADCIFNDKLQKAKKNFKVLEDYLNEKDEAYHERFTNIQLIILDKLYEKYEELKKGLLRNDIGFICIDIISMSREQSSDLIPSNISPLFETACRKCLEEILRIRSEK